jgi:hypothetical protein
MSLEVHQREIARVRKYYEEDEKQQGFNLLLLGEPGSGKTPILLTARKPVYIDSFDPKGTVGLKKWINNGQIIADTRWEDDDPYDPTAFGEWEKKFKKQYASGFFDHLGTYVIDSATTFTEAAMNFKMGEAGRAGYTPHRNKDYNPAKVIIQNYLRRCLNLSCDFILTGHLKAIDKLIRVDKKTGIETRKISYRFLTIGQAATFIPLLFSEMYVVKGEEGPRGTKRKLLTDAVGEYIARSKLSAGEFLDAKEEPDIKAILEKVGLSVKDKPLFK